MESDVATPEELVARFQQGDAAAFEELLVLFDPLLRRTVRHFVQDPACEYFEDVQQAARIGLLDAVTAFDSARGLRFATYAPWRINGSIRDMLRMEGTIRVPRLEMAKAKVNGGYRMGRLGDPVRQQGEVVVLADVVPDRHTIAPVYEMMGIDDLDILFWSIAKLPDVAQLVIMLRLEGQTLREIGSLVELSESRISQAIDGYFAALAGLVQARRNAFKPNRIPLSDMEYAYLYLVRKTRTPEQIADDLRRTPEFVHRESRHISGSIARGRESKWQASRKCYARHRAKRKIA